MTAVIDRRLFAIANRLADLLRGVDDPDVFVGTREGLAAEIGRIFDEPILRREKGPSRVTYRQALMTSAISSMVSTTTSDREGDDAISILVEGLRSPMTLAAAPRNMLDVTMTRNDLADLLHRPLLRAYLRGGEPGMLSGLVARSLPSGECDVRPLPLGGGVSLTASFGALRTAVALDAVRSWQVPGEIVLSEKGTLA